MAGNRFVLDRSWSSVFASSSGSSRILDGTKDKGQKVVWEIRLRQVELSRRKFDVCSKKKKKKIANAIIEYFNKTIYSFYWNYNFFAEFKG